MIFQFCQLGQISFSTRCYGCMVSRALAQAWQKAAQFSKEKTKKGEILNPSVKITI